MTYSERIRAAQANPERLEQMYRQALQHGERSDFISALEEAYAAAPENVLFSAWHFRLRYEPIQPARRSIPWAIAIPLAALNGLLFWWLSADQYRIQVDGSGYFPLLLFMWAPIAAVFVMMFLSRGERGQVRLAVAIGGLALAVAAYPLWAHTFIRDASLRGHYLQQMIPHLALLAWAAVGLFVLRGRSDALNRFAFLLKSLEVFWTAGLFVIAGGIFVAITVGLFETLAITLPDGVMRLLVFGGAGLLPVLSVGLVYDPTSTPAAQSFEEGLSKVIAALMQALLPLTLIVLTIYLGFIPFRFWEPFQSREVLFAYNAMLFAVMALLVGATPIQPEKLTPIMGYWLRRGLIVVALIAGVVGLYALTAIGYRTWSGGLTLNRLTVMGWNVINIGILVRLLWGQMKADDQNWSQAMRVSFAAGMPLYVAWALGVVLGMPWLFR